jgi:hypothetical protein
MRRLVGLLAVTGSLLSQTPAADVVGRWRSVETSKGGIGSIIQLRKGGVVDYSPGAVVEMKYRLEGDELILPPATTHGPELRQKIEFQGLGRLSMATGEGGVMAMTRQGAAPDAANPLLGEWTAPREMNGQHVVCRYIFYPGGKALLLIPFLTKTGRYTIQGTRMKIDIPTLGATEGTYQRSGDFLTLPLGRTGKVRYALY